MTRRRSRIPGNAPVNELPPLSTEDDGAVSEAAPMNDLPPETPAPDPRRQAESPRRANPRAEAARARDRGAAGDRIPLGVPTLKLSLRDYSGQLEGYVPRWVNDTGDRIQRALRGGYAPIYKDGVEIGDGDDDSYNPDQDTWVSKHVGTHDNGQSIRAYAMKIRREWYEADQAEKQKIPDDIDAQIKRGEINKADGDGRYLKTAHYQIGSKT